MWAWFQERVGKAEVEQVLDRFFTEVMVDAEDGRFGKDGMQDLVQSLSRGEIAAKGLLHDHASIVGEARLPQPFDDGVELVGGDCQIEQRLPGGTKRVTQFYIGRLVTIVTGDILEQRAEFFERCLIHATVLLKTLMDPGQ